MWRRDMRFIGNYYSCMISDHTVYKMNNSQRNIVKQPWQIFEIKIDRYEEQSERKREKMDEKISGG